MKLLHRISLTSKMTAVTILVGLAVWFILDSIQSSRIENIFISQLAERLGQQAMEDRLRFDRVIKAHHQAAGLFVQQQNFIDYVGIASDKTPGDTIKTYDTPPPWFPDRSVLRAIIQPYYAILIDSGKRVREVYHRRGGIPEILLNPPEYLIDNSLKQSYLTSIDNMPYVIASAFSAFSRGSHPVTLMIATPIDDRFLSQSIESSTQRDVVALLAPGDNPRVLTSSNLKEIPEGITVSSLEGKYIMTGKEFFDYGSSDLVVKMASFISVARVDALTRQIIAKERRERALSAIVFIIVFALVTYTIARRIQNLSERVAEFSRRILGTKPSGMQKGDQIYELESRFQSLTDEVIRSREIIKRQAEEQTRLIVENAFDAIITINAKGIITSWNPQAEKIFGRPEEEAVGKKLSETIIPSAYIPGFERDLRQFADMAVSPLPVRPFEIQAAHKDGHHFPVELSASCTRTAGEDIFIIIIRDISERKKAEEETRMIQARLIHTNKMTALGTLVSGIAHEINNPNSFIMSNAQLFRDIWKDVFHILEGHYQRDGDFMIGDLKFSELRDEVPKVLNSISNGAERIRNIVEALKSFSRPDLSGMDSRIDINKTVETAMLFLSNSVKKYTETFRIEYGHDIPPVKGNPQQLEQVVVNLVMNAIQSFDDRKGMVRILTGYEPGNNSVIIEVTDNGKGIPEELIDSITEPFFSTRLDKGGTGLGLSICKAIIQDHKGTLEFRSEPGVGTTVSVKLPPGERTPCLN